MTHLLLEAYPDYDYTILHINHGLRGRAADDDGAFVRDLASKLNISFECRHYDLRAIQAVQGGNLEELGRELRYSAAYELLAELEVAYSATEQLTVVGLNQQAKLVGGGRIFTAHSADDRVETFLMRVIRGSGTSALSSIPYIRGKLARPLLDCERGDLRQWLTERKHQWREDETNNDTHYLRAYLRHVVVPLMQSQNPNLTTAVTRSLEILSTEDDFIEQSLDAWLEDERAKVSAQTSGYYGLVNTGTGENPVTNNSEASSYQTGAMVTTIPGHPALARRLIRRLYQSVAGDTSKLSFEHVENIRNNWQTHGFAIDLPGSVSVRTLYGKLHFIAKQASTPFFYQNLQKNQVLETSLGNMIFTDLDPELFRSDPVAYARQHAGRYHLIIDTDLLEAYAKPLVVSSLVPKTRFSPLGMPGKMKLVSDLLIDRKIPFYERNKLLMLSVGGEIVWVVGVQADDRFKVRPESVRLSSIMIASNNS